MELMGPQSESCAGAGVTVVGGVEPAVEPDGCAGGGATVVGAVFVTAPEIERAGSWVITTGRGPWAGSDANETPKPTPAHSASDPKATPPRRRRRSRRPRRTTPSYTSPPGRASQEGASALVFWNSS